MKPLEFGNVSRNLIPNNPVGVLRNERASIAPEAQLPPYSLVGCKHEIWFSVPMHSPINQGKCKESPRARKKEPTNALNSPPKENSNLPSGNLGWTSCEWWCRSLVEGGEGPQERGNRVFRWEFSWGNHPWDWLPLEHSVLDMVRPTKLATMILQSYALPWLYLWQRCDLHNFSGPWLRSWSLGHSSCVVDVPIEGWFLFQDFSSTKLSKKERKTWWLAPFLLSAWLEDWSTHSASFYLYLAQSLLCNLINNPFFDLAPSKTHFHNHSLLLKS